MSCTGRAGPQWFSSILPLVGAPVSRSRSTLALHACDDRRYIALFLLIFFFGLKPLLSDQND